MGLNPLKEDWLKVSLRCSWIPLPDPFPVLCKQPAASPLPTLTED